MAETKPEPTPPPPPPPELTPALAALDRGDFQTARRLAGELLAGKPAPEVETATRAVLTRLAIDPWALRIGVAAAVVLALIMGAYLF